MNEYFSFTLLGYKLRSRTKNFLIWTTISLCFFILIVVMFSNLLSAGLPEFIRDMANSMPGAVTGTGGNQESIDFNDFGVNFGVCLQIMLIVGCVYASYLGASANTNGRGDSDVTFVYSLPISRTCAVLTGFIAQFVTLFFHNIVVALMSIAVLYSNNKMTFLGKVLLAIGAFLLIEIIYLAISFLLATFMNSGSQASSISAVVVTITILFGILGSMAKSLGLLKILSPYSYISIFGIITGESRLYVIGIAAGLLMTVVSLVLSCVRYDQIDLIMD